MLLSLCIPTYNRASQLQTLLESVALQRDHGLHLEIVVSDNASTDDTPAIIDAHMSAGMNIVYRRLPENLGFDRNLLNVVAMAQGEYCWLFGSDDKMEVGALTRVEQLLRGHPSATGFNVGSNGYSSDLARPIAFVDHISSDFPIETTLQGRDRIVDAVGPWGLGFISSIIVQRASWAAAVASSPVERYSNGFIHTYVLLRMLNKQSTWVCIPDRLVGWRSGNDSVINYNEFTRTRLDIVEFDRAFGDTLGRHGQAYHASMRKVATFYIRSHFINAKMNGVSIDYWRSAIPMSIGRYWRYPSFWTRTFAIALIPRPLLLLMRHLSRRMRNGSAAT